MLIRFFSSEKGGENHQLYSRLAALGFITHSCLPVSITSWYRSCMSLNGTEFTNSPSHNCFSWSLNGSKRVWPVQCSCFQLTKHALVDMCSIPHWRQLLSKSQHQICVSVGFNVRSAFILILWVTCFTFYETALWTQNGKIKCKK